LTTVRSRFPVQGSGDDPGRQSQTVGVVGVVGDVAELGEVVVADEVGTDVEVVVLGTAPEDEHAAVTIAVSTTAMRTHGGCRVVPGTVAETSSLSHMASEGLHEPLELLDEATIDYHRAMTSLCEELEAVDWYDQRVKATTDASLAAVLAHNRDEEKEHAAMTLEWLRRRDPVLASNLRTYLFTSDPITEVEAEAEEPGSDGVAKGSESGSLAIGSLKGRE
jgi:hypothetical protein